MDNSMDFTSDSIIEHPQENVQHGNILSGYGDSAVSQHYETTGYNIQMSEKMNTDEGFVQYDMREEIYINETAVYSEETSHSQDRLIINENTDGATIAVTLPEVYTTSVGTVVTSSSVESCHDPQAASDTYQHQESYETIVEKTTNDLSTTEDEAPPADPVSEPHEIPPNEFVAANEIKEVADKTIIDYKQEQSDKTAEELQEIESQGEVMETLVSDESHPRSQQKTDLSDSSELNASTEDSFGNARVVESEEIVADTVVDQETCYPIEEVTVKKSESYYPIEEVTVKELGPNEIIESNEGTIEYTVVEEEDPPKEQEEEEVHQTVVVIREEDVESEADNSSECVITIEEVGEDDVNKEYTPKKKGRRPKNELPLHLLGHNIEKPSCDVPNGKPVPKPRLGVKVPYRNLTSQIVSRQELQNEIVERARQKQIISASSMPGDILFARKLTQRLAKKISPLPIPTAMSTLSNNNTEEKKEDDNKLDISIKYKNKTQNIDNNSDLIAILEGDGAVEDTDLANASPKTKSEETEDAEKTMRELEREIALKQLEELPMLSSSKPRTESKYVSDEKKPKIKEEVSKAKATPSVHKLVESPTPTKASKVPEEVEPQLKPSMVLKTYTRKRKSEDIPMDNPKKPVIESPPPELKNEVLITSPVYVTKSSRVIKKKIIWDPDEIPSPKNYVRSSLSKIDLPSTSKTSTPKPVEKKNSTERKSSNEKEKKSIEKKTSIEKEKKQTLDKEKKPTSDREKKPTSDKVEKKSDKSEKGSDKPEKGSDKPEKERSDKSEKDKSGKPEREREKIPELKPTPEHKEKLMDKPKEKKVIPKKNLSPKKGKRLSEIDKLLMDEGAVNMIYDVKNTEDKIKKKVKNVISLDKAQRELMSKTNEIKNDLQLNTSELTKSLRKKEGVPPPVLKKEVPAPVLRKKSKDSIVSHSPPASPSFSYAEASRIIRRHSSSSFSSADELSDEHGGKPVRKKSLSESPKKKIKKDHEKKVTKEERKQNEGDSVEHFKSPEEDKGDARESVNVNKSFVVTKKNKHTCIDLNYNGTEGHFTVQMLKDLTHCLRDLGKSKDCNVVSIISSASEYCLGLDYKGLVESNEDLRKKRATELSTCVRDFLKCLLHFPKILVAGIQGHCVGLGVTMLSLFDVVVASDTALFSAPYGSLGCVPEGGFLLTLPHLSNYGLASELFYTSQKIKAEEAYRRGLVTKLCWPEKYHTEVKAILTNIAAQSSQSLEATKKQLRQANTQVVEAALSSNTKQLVELWISDECQKHFVNFKATN